jgi:hypothetical protein
MYVNGKMIPVETIQGMGEGGKKENGGGMNSSMIYLIYCKNFCKCHNVPLPNTIKKIILKMSYFIIYCLCKGKTSLFLDLHAILPISTWPISTIPKSKISVI